MAFRSFLKVFPSQTSSRFLVPVQVRRFAQEDSNPTSAPSDPDRTKDLETRLKALETEALQYKDLYIRSVAEQENIRKRLSKEIENEASYSISKFAKEMLEVSDNLERALNNTSLEKAQENPEKSLKALLEGVTMTRDILKGVYGKFGIVEYCPNSEKFDPNVHEALMAYEDKSKEAGTVGQVFVNGYKIKDRVLRCAKVGVVKK